MVASVNKASEIANVEVVPTDPFEGSKGVLREKAVGTYAVVSTTGTKPSISLNLGVTAFGVELPATQKAAGVQVSTDGSAVLLDPAGKLDLAVQGFDTGAVRVNAVLNSPEAPTVHEYKLNLPSGARLVGVPDTGSHLVVVKQDTLGNPNDAEPVGGFDYPQGPAEEEAVRVGNAEAEAENGKPYDDGEAEALAASVGISEDEVPVLRIESPWAVDANGVSLPTRYTVQGNTLTQVIDTRGASFPVVADPVFIPIIIALAARAAVMAAPAVARAFAAQVIKHSLKASIRGGYKTFAAFKKAHVTGKEKTHDWHHIVEQSMIKLRGWDPKTIHNARNMIQIPRKVHQQCINKNMAKKDVNLPSIGSLPGWSSGPYNTLRSSIRNLSWQKQYEIGVLLLAYCGVKV